jgi:trimeric autotransporter adhesin
VGTPAPQFTAASVVNAASYTGGAVAPGEIVTIFGSNFGTTANTQVQFGTVAAVLVFVNSTQVSATVPYSVADATRTSLTINANGVASAPVTLAVAPSSPAIFTADSSGKGQASAENSNYSINGPSHPAAAGSFVALYGTGGGPLTTDTPPRLMLPVSATVGGMPAEVLYAGVAPGLIQGVMQINVAIPSAVTPGPSVPVVVTVGDAVSNTVTLAIE